MRTVAALLLLLSAFASLELRSAAAAHLRRTRTYEPRDFVPAPEALQALSLGYERALADLLWMRALVYVGEEFGERRGGEAVFRHADALLALDPDFRKVYEWIGVVGTYRLGEVSTADYLRTVSYLRRGAERFPDDLERRWDLGATLVFDQPRRLREEDPELAERLEVEGLEHVMYATRRGHGPSWMVFATAGKLQDLGRTEQALDNLRQMHGLVDDPAIRRDIERQIAALEAEAATLSRNAEIEHLNARHMETYPWVPLGLFILIDDPESDRLMGDAPDAMLDSSDESTNRPATNADDGIDPRGDGDRHLRGR